MCVCCRYEQLGKTAGPERAEQHRRTLRQALHVWLDQFPEDFCEPPNFPCLSHLGTEQTPLINLPVFMPWDYNFDGLDKLLGLYL